MCNMRQVNAGLTSRRDTIVSYELKDNIILSFLCTIVDDVSSHDLQQFPFFSIPIMLCMNYV